tara:strand:- start:4469 stop:5434 length:966 start_codon:yes stop_codon:yes gene_type:complete
MNRIKNLITILFFFSMCLSALNGCTSSTRGVDNSLHASAPQVSPTLKEETYHGLKRVVAISRFTDETKRGRSLFFQQKNSVIGKQASDILSTRLSSTGKFMMLERQDLKSVQAESASKSYQGADFIIVGSVSEYGRETTSEVGVFSRNRVQKSYAAVNVRLIDVRTSEVIYSEEARGEARSENNHVFGVGETAGYNSSLDDKALSAAISKLVSNVIENLMDLPWKGYLVNQQDDMFFMTGGQNQGIHQGDLFMVKLQGKKVKNPQTGSFVYLPRKQVAQIKVVDFVGKGKNSLSRVEVVSGAIEGPLSDYTVFASQNKDGK